jgi:hypothetical protein
MKEEKVDAFGSPAEETEEGVNETPEEKKEYNAIPEDHPIIKSLNEQIESLKADKESMGGNLSAQRELIKRMEKEKADLTGGKKPEGEGQGKEGETLLYTDIKWSKDLSEDERDEMTDSEIKQMDEIAAMKEAQNKMYAQLQTVGSTTEKVVEQKEVEDKQSLIKETAMELADNDRDLANKIIENMKQFNLEGLNEGQIKERVANAHKLLPDYKPPKEGSSIKGSPVKSGSDPFAHNDKVVEEVTKGSSGTYSL